MNLRVITAMPVCICNMYTPGWSDETSIPFLSNGIVSPQNAPLDQVIFTDNTQTVKGGEIGRMLLPEIR